MRWDVDSAALPPPAWLAEEAWLRALLGRLLDRLETPRQRDVTLRIRRNTVRELFQFSENSQYRWGLVEQLSADYRIFTIRLDPRIEAHQERYENAQLRLNPGCEDLLRNWLQRPRLDPFAVAWQAAVARQRECFLDGGASLLAAPIAVDGYTPDELVDAFAAIRAWLDQALTLREIAARCFRGDSKFLDSRVELLTKLYGEQLAGIAPRPLLLSACAPPGFGQLLIVENQDSFLRLAQGPPPGVALLYSGGFRASAGRLASEHTQFAFLPGSDAQRFSARWLDRALPVFFWGDLDFAGMGILKALRQSLPALRAWEPGYQPMLELLARGAGHCPGQAGKGGQVDPLETGCPYSDRTLLPALRHCQRFVDQEAIAVTGGRPPGHASPG
jgi:Wadjet protein JetD, C-terminal